MGVVSFDRLLLQFALLHGVLAAQPSAPSPIAAPLRELPWGQLNFLHTTDTHGWHGGHLQEPQYSADWGDYISFAQHLRDRADADGSDLLLIDTGDRIEGNGLYDASNPKGKYTNDIFKEQKIDVITSGNHELYLANSSNNEYYETVPHFKNSYISSNLDIYSPETGKLESLAPRFRKFTTKNQGIRIIAFGFLFDFHGNANNTVVQPVEDTIKTQWFQDAIRDREVDLFLVAGHVPVRDSREFDAVYKAIRNVQYDTPIQFFGGHTHIRDYHKFDKLSYGIESGRYMETIGFQSISGLNAGKKAAAQSSPIFKRRYIDNNLFSMHHHTGRNSSTFPTEPGRNVSRAIYAARKTLSLDEAYGCAPQTYWLNRAPYPANNSLLTLLESEILPDVGNVISQSQNVPQIIITNSGAIRFDIFAGPFSIDTTFLVSPFTSSLRTIKNVPYTAASQVIRLLNNEGQILEELMQFSAEQEDLGAFAAPVLHQLLSPSPPIGMMTQRAAAAPHKYLSSLQNVLGRSRSTISGHHFEELTPGYTTSDDAGDDGDDTIHERITFYNVPNCISAKVNIDMGQPPDSVDLVYNAFIENWILLALRFLGQKYGNEDTQSVLDSKSFTDILSDWVGSKWKCE